ncbi:type IV pilin protein [Vibrio fluvialis]|nr:type IV pilin protein [Vibrio fluvialis]
MEMIRTNRCNRRQSDSLGMTLIELMIAVVIIGILSGIAYPAYTGYVKEGHRKQVMADMVKIQLYLEEHYNSGYFTAGVLSGGACTLCSSDTDRYSVGVTVSSSGYTITATPQAAKGQNLDKCSGSTYSQLSLRSTGLAEPVTCWQ